MDGKEIQEARQENVANVADAPQMAKENVAGEKPRTGEETHSRRIKLTVAYDGEQYCGWQRQPGRETIEGKLDQAIKALTGEDIQVIGASRTDAGVHAAGNVAVFDTLSSIPAEKFAAALNTVLPDDIAVQESRQVPDRFHPRHCKTVKTYEYTICNSEYRIPQLRRVSWHLPYKMDTDKMRAAAGYLIGTHDFRSFASSRTTVPSTVRTLYALDIFEDDPLIIIRVTGNGFLYNMVRILAGTLAMVGCGRIPVKKVHEMLEAHDRTKAGMTAPPQGLTLIQIQYPDGEDILK